MLYAEIGRGGQERLAAARVLLCGCGALGSVQASMLARAGVGWLRVVDRDFLEANNLQRQLLFDEADVAAGLPKAIAAATKLRAANSQVRIEPVVADINYANILELCEGVDCIVDGTDNFETRFLLNDAAIKRGIPWVYGGCIGAEGQTLTIVPGQSACLRCLLQDAPPPGSTPTCDTAGIVAPIIGVIASIQAMEAIKILAGRRDAVSRGLTVIDLWTNAMRRVSVQSLLEAGGCPTCRGEEFPWLEGRRGSQSVVLCGRNAIQLSPAGNQRLALDELEQKLAKVGSVNRNPFLLRFETDGYSLTVFPDGRAIIGGTEDLALARSLYAKFIGS
jgi:adenylyltransferase/sulfurtransferase